MTHADPLSATIADLVRPGRGILAADESGPTITNPNATAVPNPRFGQFQANLTPRQVQLGLRWVY